MIRLAPGEALRRKKERERIRNVQRREESKQRKMANGTHSEVPIVLTAEQQKKKNKAQSNRKYREKLKAMAPAPVVKPVAPPVITETRMPKKAKSVKSQPRMFKTRHEDLSQKIKVRLDHRTEVYIKPGQDIEEVRQRYLNR